MKRLSDSFLEKGMQILHDLYNLFFQMTIKKHDFSCLADSLQGVLSEAVFIEAVFIKALGKI